MKKKRKKSEPTMAILDQNHEPDKTVGAFKNGQPVDILDVRIGWFDFQMKDGQLCVTFIEGQKPNL